MRQAVCALIRSGELILAVSRKDDPAAFGLPGGKVDPGETPAQAVVRELKEETGLDFHDIREVFTQVCIGKKDGIDYEATTFEGTASGHIHAEHESLRLGEGVVKWVKPEVLLQGPFADYNQELFKKVGIRHEFVFNIPYKKIYEAEGRNEGVTLTAEETSELLDYIQYVTWLMNKPKK